MDLIHAFNRGVDKRQIFMDDYDHSRFVYGLYVFNDKKAVELTALRKKGLTMSFSDKRSHLVDIYGWCLMGNHYHLLLSERVPGGISSFLKKLNIGYAKYFNERHARTGTLYQGRTRQVRIETDAHYLHILNYIHLNPLDFCESAKTWREGSVKDFSKAVAHLNAYPWSSYAHDKQGSEFAPIVTKKLLGSKPRATEKHLKSYLKDLLEKDIVSPF